MTAPRHRAYDIAARDMDRMVGYVAGRKEPPTPWQAATALLLTVDEVWEIIAEDDRLDVIQDGHRKRIVMAEFKFT